MAGQVAIALYRPKPKKAKALEKILSKHVSTLRAAGLATSRPVTLLKSYEDDTYLEIFEWTDEKAANKAHSNPAVMKIWDAMGDVASFTTLGALAEAKSRFPHFRPVDGVTA